MAEFDSKDILRGKIAGTKGMVRKQIKEMKIIEEEVDNLLSGDIKHLEDEGLERISKVLREFHICAENALGFIAESFDEGIPRVDNVHRALVEQMTRENAGSRPAVLDGSIAERLLGYLQFRLDFERDRMEGNKETRVLPLAKDLKITSNAIRQQLMDFFEALNKFHELE